LFTFIPFCISVSVLVSVLCQNLDVPRALSIGPYWGFKLRGKKERKKKKPKNHTEQKITEGRNWNSSFKI
jgi:hypothetical protein